MLERAVPRMGERVVLEGPEQGVVAVVRGHWGIAEDVLGAAQPGAQAVCGRLEHMFESLG
jgi:hypothetical protein